MKGHVSIHGNVQLAQQLSPDIFLHEDDDKDEEKPKRKRWNLLEPFEKDGKTICFDFQLDRCKKGAACARNHVCGICGTAGHTAGKCTK